MMDDLIYKYVAAQKGRLIGYFPVSFPVYVVHTEYDSVDSDPFFPLYRALLQYTLIDKTHEHLAYFSYATGFDLDLLKRCVKQLKEKGMLLFQKTEYKVTDDANRKYLIANNRPTVRVSGAFVVDGKSLNLLPPYIYRNKRTLSSRVDQNVTAHVPVDLFLNKSAFDKMKSELEKGKTKELLNMETSGSNFEIIGIDKRYLCGANAVFYVDEEGGYHKDVLYLGEPIQCDALEPATAYTIQMVKQNGNWSFKPNLGYNVANVNDVKEVTLVACDEGVSSLLIGRYGLAANSVVNLKLDEESRLYHFEVDEQLLFNAEYPLKVIDDARRGYIDFRISSTGVVRIYLHNKIGYYVQFVDMVDNWNACNEMAGDVFVEELKESYPQWRSYFVRFGKLDILERIDIDCFIQKF